MSAVGCPLFVELCAGTAALSLRLHAPRAKPPVSRMGSKAGYANALLRLLGLAPGQGYRDRTRYLWCEPDPGVRLLLEAYRDPELAKGAAEIIRGWAGEDPRALWERLRAEGPVRDVGGQAVAGEVARWAWVQGHGDSSKPPRLAAPYQNPDGNAEGAWKAPPRDWLARRLDDAPTLPAAIAPDARTVNPREVARWLAEAWLTYGQASGNGFRATAGGTWPDRPPDVTTAADRLHGLPHVPAAILPDAREVDPGPDLPPGTVVYMDPPYQGTTGYGHDLPRVEVVALARRWAAAGATVAISEAEPIPQLVGEGWRAVRIDGERVGQKRTFSRQQAEWVTMSRAPAWTPAVQGGLFGSAS